MECEEKITKVTALLQSAIQAMLLQDMILGADVFKPLVEYLEAELKKIQN